MKIRTDFVTNSSSSSFIVSTNNELEEKKHIIERVTKENLATIFQKMYGPLDYLDSKYSVDEIKEMFKFNDEQMLILGILDSHYASLDEYIKLITALEKNKYVYYIAYEWCGENDEMCRKIIKDSQIIIEDN